MFYNQELVYLEDSTIACSPSPSTAECVGVEGSPDALLKKRKFSVKDFALRGKRMREAKGDLRVLDSWQLAQLCNMKVGGNQSATEFFTKHRGSKLLNNADTKRGYSSRHKGELAKRVGEGATRHPKGIFTKGVAIAPTTSPNKEVKALHTKKHPNLLRPDAANSRSYTATPSSPPTTKTAVPRTTTSSAAARAAKPSGASRLAASGSTGGSSATGVRKSKLGFGAVKVAKTIDFEEAERKAREEEERILQLGQPEEEEEKARKEGEEAKGDSRGCWCDDWAGEGCSVPKVWVGIIPSAAAAVATSSRGLAVGSSIPDDSTTTARDEFGNQKGIYPDMYFGRGG